MSDAPDIKVIAAKIARVAFDLATGDRGDAMAAIKEIAGLAIDAIPVDEYKEFLTARDKEFGELATDIAEAVKLAGE
jgi:hypothetical protein